MENIAPKEAKSGKRSLPKKLIRIDMTPMVDLGFLLITFFMFTTNFSKPNVMDLSYPQKPTEKPHEIDFRNQLTFLLGKDNRIFYYQIPESALKTQNLNETSLEGSAIGRLISAYKKVAPDQKKFTVIIKPTDDSSYKNFIDMLDNMTLTKSELYGIGDLKPLEKSVYEEKIK